MANHLRERIEHEEQWLASLQLPSGAIPMNRGSSRLNPYFTNLGLMGLADNPAYADTVRNWLQWYVEHINRPDPWGLSGTLFDYEIQYGQARPTGDYDSSDSYAATLLTLARAYYDTTGDAAYLGSIEQELRLIASAMIGTLDTGDHLTYAKPHYRIKYLMDNAEVYRGLIDWAYLLDEVFDDARGAEESRKQAEKTRAGLVTMWQRDRFAYAKDERGRLFPADWRKWYPDATAQLFPIWSGVLHPSDPQAQALWDRFNAEQPLWVRHGHPDAFPWTVVGYAAALMGDWERAEAYVDVIHARYGERGRLWPWHVGESGWYLRTLKMLVER